MPLDPLSPIAPARVRVLLLPMGRIKGWRFQAFVARLEPQFLVRLGDISPDARPDRNMFSPAAFPNGVLIYDFSTHLPAPSHLALSPFEIFREPLMILGLADGTEYASIDPTAAEDWEHDRLEQDIDTRRKAPYSMDSLFREMDLLRARYPHILVHKLLIFDNIPVSTIPPLMPDGVVCVPPVEKLKTTTMKTIICDVTATLLAELTSYARSIQALSTIDSPSNSESSALAWSSQSNLSVGQDNSGAAALSRNSSPVDFEKKMNVPAQPPFSSDRPSGLTGSRPSTPQDGLRGRSALGRETGVPNGRPHSEIGPPGSTARSNITAEARDASREGMSIQGFGSGSLSERNRNRGKGRIGIVIGTFYLLAGRWNDALKELVESTNRVRAFSDHIWYAKGVENILVCLLLCAWKGIDFEISSVVSPYADRAPPPKPSAQTNRAGTLDAPNSNDPATEAAHAALAKLSELLPDSLNMIMSIYDRAAANANEALPETAFSEVIIRISKLFATLHVFGGNLTRDALEALICCKPLESFAPTPSSRLFIRPLRRDIAELSFKALPQGLSTMTVGDRIIVLAGIASVLSMLGFQRKKAIIVKEFLAIFVPSLVDARKAGAAELGVHPAAGLSTLSMIGSSNSEGSNTLSEHGFKELLVAVGKIYGVHLSGLLQDSQLGGTVSAVNGKNGVDDAHRLRSNTSANLLGDVAEEAVLRSFGSLHLKYDILRTGLSFCEALPDFNGVLHLSAAMLRIAGPAIVSGLNTSAAKVALAKEEQVRLVTNVPRTLGAAKSLGLKGLEVDYWDDFLVKDIRFIETSSSLQPIGHSKSELGAETNKEIARSTGPFIYDPSSKPATADIAENILIAHDQSRFALVIQNPYDFEVAIEWLELAVVGIELSSQQQDLTLAPFCIQTIPINVVALQPGELKVIGCLIKVRGCRVRNFPIFNRSWAPEPETKVKSIGLPASKPPTAHRVSQDVSPRDQTSPTLPGPVPSTLQLAVIPEQPLLEIGSVSLSQASVMILEGERQVFSVTLQNVATKTRVDLLLISFQDSTIAPIQAAMKNKHLPRPELYELELQYLHNQAFRLRHPERLSHIAIESNQSMDLEFEVLGKPGLSDGVIQFDYAHVGVPRSEIEDRFFTRRTSLPLSVTVNASVMFQRLDIVPFSSDFAWSNQHRLETTSSKISGNLLPCSEVQANRFSALLDRVGRDGTASEHCLVLIDLRNAWPNPITVSIDVLQPSSSPATTLSLASSKEGTRTYTVHEYLYPGHTTRLLVLLPKLYLQDPYAPVPILDEKNKRQFVKSQGQLSPEAERDVRERFWYREELFKYVKGCWKEEAGIGGNGREGEVDLRGIRLSRRMLDCLKLEDVAIELSILPSEGAAENVVRRAGRGRFRLRVDEFVVLRTKIQNRSLTPIEPILRLLPTLVDQTLSTALDVDRKLAWTGLLQRVLPQLSAGAVMEVELGFCALYSGEYEIGASVEEIRLLQDVSPMSERKGQGRGRSGTVVMSDDLIRDRGRRIWYAPESCRIVAIEDV